MDSSYESGIYIQIIFLTVMFFYFAICVLICHLQKMALSILIKTWVFIIYFSRMQTIFFSSEFFNVVLSSWSQYLSWWICEKKTLCLKIFFLCFGITSIKGFTFYLLVRVTTPKCCQNLFYFCLELMIFSLLSRRSQI